MDWHENIQIVKPHVMRIGTPESSGTGFLVRRKDGRFGVATAGHVVRDAFAWKQNITIHHPAFEEPLVLSEDERVVLLHPKLDSAYVEGDLPALTGDTFPEEPIELVPPKKSVKLGVEVGWLGFPYLVSKKEPCFFAGHVSAYVDGRYFIDGVAIPGVSGGPAFFQSHSRGNNPAGLRVLGSISAYHPARQGGESLPGLMVADDCTHWPKVFDE